MVGRKLGLADLGILGGPMGGDIGWLAESLG